MSGKRKTKCHPERHISLALPRLVPLGEVSSRDQVTLFVDMLKMLSNQPYHQRRGVQLDKNRTWPQWSRCYWTGNAMLHQPADEEADGQNDAGKRSVAQSDPEGCWWR